MTFEQFKYVLEVAKCGSFNQAANTMFLSQSTLSTSIKNLEEELGQPIFFRNNRGIQLTSFGRDFISYITPICTQMSQLEQLCKQKKIAMVFASLPPFVLSCISVIGLSVSIFTTMMELVTIQSSMLQTSRLR